MVTGQRRHKQRKNTCGHHRFRTYQPWIIFTEAKAHGSAANVRAARSVQVKLQWAAQAVENRYAGGRYLPPVSARKHLRIFPGRQRATTGPRTGRQSLALATLWFENETRVTALAAEVTVVRVAFLLTLHLAGRTVLVRGFVVPGIRRSGGSSWGFTVFYRVNTLGAACKRSDHRGIRGW